MINNKLSLAIVSSICLHFILFIFINQQFQEESLKPVVTQSINENDIIKSFLYQRAVGFSKLEINKSDVSIQKKHVVVEKEDIKNDIVRIPKSSTNNKNPNKNLVVSKSKLVKTRTEKSSVSVLSSLSKLRKKMNEKTIEIAVQDRYRSLSAKIMAGTAPVVPHSFRIETREEKIKKTAMSMNHYGSTVVFKDDNGICTTIRDLTNVGLDIRKGIKQSRCGLSKFDKSFKKHMSSVIEKLMNK
ncbi:MAG: hypothetical protein HRT53_16880 [Colwellia sp.]|nr:hypothetical protein [Colwellia sp.]